MTRERDIASVVGIERDESAKSAVVIVVLLANLTSCERRVRHLYIPGHRTIQNELQAVDVASRNIVVREVFRSSAKALETLPNLVEE